MSPDPFDDIDRALAGGLSALAPEVDGGDETLARLRPRFQRARSRNRVMKVGGTLVALVVDRVRSRRSRRPAPGERTCRSRRRPTTPAPITSSTRRVVDLDVIDDYLGTDPEGIDADHRLVLAAARLAARRVRRRRHRRPCRAPRRERLRTAAAATGTRARGNGRGRGPADHDPSSENGVRTYESHGRHASRCGSRTAS